MKLHEAFLCIKTAFGGSCTHHDFFDGQHTSPNLANSCLQNLVLKDQCLYEINDLALNGKLKQKDTEHKGEIAGHR